MTRQQMLAHFDRYSALVTSKDDVRANIRSLIETLPNSNDVLKECLRHSFVWGLSPEGKDALQLILKSLNPIEDRIIKKKRI